MELLISTSIAMVLASVATTAYIQLSRAVARAEARMAMFSSAQRLYTQLHRILASVQPSCAMVVKTVANGEVRFIFMRAIEDEWDFVPPANDTIKNSTTNPDLVWEEWVWLRSTQTLRMASSSRGTPTYPGRYFISGSFTPAGVNYSGKAFYAVPQPRRTLDPVDPTDAATNSLNDNIYFPNSASPAVSLANPKGDIGDFTDLENGLVPVLKQVSDLSFELITHDGTSIIVDDSATTAPPRVFQGVWPDGRLAPTLSAAPAFATSDLARRPRTLRLRFTLSDSRAGVASTFSFSFALPGLSPTP
jgi:hypothetical protein